MTPIPDNHIKYISQWDIWQCSYNGKHSYHPNEKAARQQLTYFRQDDDLYGDEKRLMEAE